MRRRRHVKDCAWTKLVDLSVLHGGRSPARDHETDVFHLAERCACHRSDVLGPLPSRLICGAPDCEPTDCDDFKLSELELTRLIRLLKPLQDHIVHISSFPLLEP